MDTIGDHAIVLGASVGGLLAARALADAYRAVTVVERDVLPDGAENRRGVPQGRHGHTLLPRGAQIADELFPGILDELVADGAPTIPGDDLSALYFVAGGHLMARSGALRDRRITYVPSRPLLERHIRRRVRAIPNITVLDGHSVGDLTTTPDRHRVTGVQVGSREGVRTLTADLVVDAMGRGARTPAHLERFGYGRPTEEHVRVHVTYRSQLFRLPSHVLSEKIVLVGARAGRPTGMALLGYENDTWLFTASGMMGHEPPCDRTDMIDFVEPFTPGHVVAALRAAEPLGDVAQHKFPSSRWRHYEQMRRFPDGLLVFGDAICSFNPLYGQGMTVAAIEATTLGRCLRRGDHELSRRFFRAAAKPIGVAWQLAVGSDLALPEVEGPRTVRTRLDNAYVGRILAAAENDPVVVDRFLRVSSLIDPPSHLFHPALVGRVCAGNLRRHRKADGASAAIPDERRKSFLTARR
ncbi:FAD-dependent oxidoreductase [Rhodococcus gordoniae]|uniref:FAD-dependent oxidoreductase n=1 Tax=Rhodococcus gordoniae TaxID=223392 RepID=UPI0020CBFB32|nr:FAD-dependent monooxygenase [Rhodococcus gordoniae]UTT50512.1 2-polyprenyl-6-methoxyphenol hydroxylase-like oxidoreductase [Rhodococcus gordoniae]